MRIALTLLSLLIPSFVSAQALTISPTVVENGGVAVLRWNGTPPSIALARFNDQVFYLTPDERGASALLGVDLETESGTYPVLVAVTDRVGRSFHQELVLEVREASRPAERLTLPREMVTPKDPAVLRRIERESAMMSEIFSRHDSPVLWKSFVRPVDDPVGSIFGLRRILNGQPRSPHAGVDFRSGRGTPVKATAAGRVVFAGDLYYTGGTVVLDHGGGLFTLYAHLDERLCTEDQFLESGTILGTVGSTGRSTGPHLHWGVKLRGNRIDPLALVELFGGERP